MKDKLAHYARIALRLLFVPKCVGCGLRMPPDSGAVLCPVCRAGYENEKENTCSVCGGRMADCLCLPREMQKRGVKRMAKLYYYEPQRGEVGARLIYTLKHKNLCALQDFLGKELAASLRPLGEEGDLIVTYPPRSRRGIRHDGFDHAEALSAALAKHLSGTHMCTLRRTRDSAQKTLSRTARLAAAVGDYALMPNIDLRGRRVVLCDDVCTTGATLRACARLLRSAGAKEVVLATLAVTPQKNPR